MSRNSVRKYLSQLDSPTDNLTNKELADKAYNNEQLQSNTQRKLQLLEHFKYAESELVKTGVTRPVGASVSLVTLIKRLCNGHLLFTAGRRTLINFFSYFHLVILLADVPGGRI